MVPMEHGDNRNPGADPGFFSEGGAHSFIFCRIPVVLESCLGGGGGGGAHLQLVRLGISVWLPGLAYIVHSPGSLVTQLLVKGNEHSGYDPPGINNKTEGAMKHVFSSSLLKPLASHNFWAKLMYIIRMELFVILQTYSRKEIIQNVC